MKSVQALFRSKALLCAVSATALGFAITAPAIAQERPADIVDVKVFNIPVQPLSRALADFTRQSKINVIAPSSVTDGVKSTAVSGSMAPNAALKMLLGDADLELSRQPNGSIVLSQVEAPRARTSSSFRLAQVQAVDEADQRSREDEPLKVDTIIVTGTNIRGIAPESSPTIVFDRADIDATGFQNTEELLRSVPQVFGGGATSLTSRLPNSEGNVSNGTGVNLRGLGGGATLVLLNGKRFAPSGLFGSFVDVSSIPLNAVEKIDILTDGASSIYGADAVGGVINFTLRDDFDGAETSLSYGSTTEEGRTRFVGSQTLGKTWGSGNGLVTYEYSDEGELFADERDFASNAPNPLSLMPGRERHSVIGVFNQEISEGLKFSFNSYYANADSTFTINTGGLFNGLFETESNVEQLLLAPSLSYRLPVGWDIDLSASYSETTDKTDTFFSGKWKHHKFDQ